MAGTQEKTLSHAGLSRHYLVHVPRSYDARAARPVLYAFHGGGGDMNYQAKNYDLVEKSEREGFLLVMPNGVGALGSQKLATWNAGSCCGKARDEAVDDVGFVRAIHSSLLNEYKVDAGRVYATGMSNGGMMSYRLACEMSDVFAAIAPVAGTDGTLTCQPKHPVSVLHIHALNDTHVLFTGGAGKDAFKDASKVTEFTSVPATLAKWAQINSCSPTPIRTFTTTGAYCEKFVGCASGAQVQACITEEGGHSWPGASKARAGKAPSQAISANDTMWSFFEQVPSRSRP